MRGRVWWGLVALLCAWNSYDHLVDGPRVRGAAEAAVVAALAAGIAHRYSADRRARRLTDDFGAFLRAEPTRAGVFLARRGADGGWQPGEEFNADEKFPLASTRKVLILCALSEQVHRGSVRADQTVPLSEIRRYRLPGTDGGAFDRAYPRARRGTPISVRACADAMIHHSCNASAEYLWRVVGGRRALDELADRHGMDHQDPVPSGYGEFLAAMPPYLHRTLRHPTGQLADRYDRLGERPRWWHRLLVLLPTGRAQARVFRHSCAGTPREWARLFQAVADGPEDGPLGFARRILRWPMQHNPANTKVYHEVLAKGGCVPGTLTQVFLVHPRTGQGPVVMACFLKDLTPAQWQLLITTTRQDDYMIQRMNRFGALA